MRHMKRIALLGLGALLLGGCDLDRTNPNAPTQEATVSTPEGLMALGVGLQTRYGAEQAAFIYANGLVTDELGAVAAALVTVSDAETGSVQGNAGLVADLWGGAYRVIKTANDIIDNADAVPLEIGTRSGLLGLAYTLKAAAYGDLVQAFQQVILDPKSISSPFVGRAEALTYALALLDTAELRLAEVPVSATFTNNVLGRGFDLASTIRAYRARLERVAGNDAAALAAANTVSRSVFSVLAFDAGNANPVFTLSSGSSGVLPRDAFRLSAPAGEEAWVGYHVAAAALTGRINTPLDNYARFTGQASPMPTYYPDEMLLIKAEMLALANDLPGARAALDSVRTDCPGAAGRTDLDPNPCLPAIGASLTTQQAILAEIYRARRYELFATGLRWEDARRRNLVGAGSAATAAGAFAERCWLPYPVGERNGRDPAGPGAVPPDPEQFDPPAYPAACPTT